MQAKGWDTLEHMAERHPSSGGFCRKEGKLNAATLCSLFVRLELETLIMGAVLEGEGMSSQPLALLGSPLVYRRKGELVEKC